MRKGISISSLLTMLFVSFLLVSCTSSTQPSSRTTGWNYNDAENGGFYITDLKEQITGPGLVAIEGGTFTMGSTLENVYYEWNNNPRKVTVSSFYMDQTEVSNLDYLEYINWLTRVYVDYPQVIENALPDTLVWRNSLSYNEPMIEIYFRHPAYRDYPVVGVSWKHAVIQQRSNQRLSFHNRSLFSWSLYRYSHNNEPRRQPQSKDGRWHSSS